MSQNCVNLFCGCDYYLGEQTDIQSKVYLSVILILVFLTISVRIGSQWFIFKDYYPMKQRSPVLCIMMIGCTCLQLILYPLAYTYNYFTMNWGEFKYIYRSIFYALDGSLYTIYLLRSLRLVYAHETDASRSKTRIFKLFKHQNFLVLFLLFIIFVKIIPILASFDSPDQLFITFIDINFYTFSKDDADRQLAFGIKQTIHQFLWLSIILYCLWTQSLVHKKYSMRNQLLMVLIIGYSFNIASIILYASQIGEQSIINQICILFPQYPILQMMRDMNVFMLFIVSIVYPLCKKRVYHMLLPIGRHHDIVKTMRDFLMQDQFLNIFSQFLNHLDATKNTNQYSQSLQFWKKLMVLQFKVSNRYLSDEQRYQCIVCIKDMIRNIEDKPIREIHANLITNLKQSIISLESCDENEEQQRIRYFEEINEKIEQLQLIFLQKLDYIYKNEYRKTKSYYFLKMYLMRNKKININMITMGMAVMVQSQDQL